MFPASAALGEGGWPQLFRLLDTDPSPVAVKKPRALARRLPPDEIPGSSTRVYGNIGRTFVK
jgi:hypothetical protein